MGEPLPLTPRQTRLLLTWSQGRELFPDEERVRRRLQEALDRAEPPAMSKVQLKILHAWAEDWWATHYGGGQVVNPDEEAILSKIRHALGWA